MQIVEIKNNLVRLHYDASQEGLILSGFVVIKDLMQSFIGQVIHLEASSGKNTAVVKLIFTFDDQGVIKNYNGSSPNVKSEVEIVESQDLLGLLPVENPIFIGELAQQNIKLNLDRKIFEDNLLICCEKQEDKKTLTENFISQLIAEGKKVLAIDLLGDLDYEQNKVVAGRDFKLPLNYETINFIYERGLDNTAPETKALIQEVFLEVQEYVKTLSDKFIPFETFKNVVDTQYEEMQLIELLLLKNRLLKYYDEGVFAQDKSDFISLSDKLEKSKLTILDLSKIDEKIQREMISYAYSKISESKEEFYFILNIENENSDKKLLKQIFTTQNAHSEVICEYSYKYLKELKQLSKNSILFAPILQQNDFAPYNVFLSKLNAGEFIIYGKITYHMPLIVKLEEIGNGKLEIEEEPSQFSPLTSPQEEIPFKPDSIDEQINNDVDELYTIPQSERYTEEDFSVEEITEELTDEDLDFIEDNVNIDTIDEILEEIVPEDTEEFEVIQLEDEVEEEAEALSKEELEEITVEPFKNPTEKLVIEQIEEEEIPSESFSDVLYQQAQEEVEAPSIDILPANMAATPIVPIYSADIEPTVQSDIIQQGDTIIHPKYGKGVVEKLISYGSKTLCSINFDNLGRRLLDPNLAEIKRVNGEQ